MQTDYRKMWQDLGMNLDNHDQLMASLSRLHKKTHLSRKNRPETMELFDRAFHDSHARRVAQILDYREKGGKSIGTFCIYVPDEIALAADVLPIPLCGGSGWSVNYADKMFPRDICPLVRSTFGMAFSGTCPYKTLKDWALGETTCDAKKKAWDLLGFKVLEVPQKKQAMDRDLWVKEVYAFKEMVEELSEKKVTAESLLENIKLVNAKRAVLRRIDEFRKLDEPPINGLDALLVVQVSMNQDIREFVENGNKLVEELEERAGKGVSAYDAPGIRVMLAGSPSPMGNAKVHYAVESSGMRVVVDESCTGLRYFRDDVDDTPGDLDTLMERVADRYFSIDCACFSPNRERMDNAREIVKEYRVEGVIHNILQYCHGYDIEAAALDKTLGELEIPSLKIVTDYSEEDVEQIKVRTDAFAEMINSRRG